MNTELKHKLKAAIDAELPLTEVVALLRQYKQQGITQTQVYSFLESLRQSASDEAHDDRIMEIADFVSGFCSPHMRIWDHDMPHVTK